MDYFINNHADWFLTERTLQCLVVEAKRQELPINLLYAVMKTEGGRPGLAMKNTNGSFDLGPMQVNTVNVKWIAQAAYGIVDPVTIKVTAAQLMFDACSSIAAGAYILKTRIVESNGNVWQGVGRYHSPGNKTLQNKYILRVYKNLPDARISWLLNLAERIYGANNK
jgi:soluble lytic murein transglycosylase-like protein